jgi:hypothetical protein
MDSLCAYGGHRVDLPPSLRYQCSTDIIDGFADGRLIHRCFEVDDLTH